MLDVRHQAAHRSGRKLVPDLVLGSTSIISGSRPGGEAPTVCVTLACDAGLGRLSSRCSRSRRFRVARSSSVSAYQTGSIASRSLSASESSRSSSSSMLRSRARYACSLGLVTARLASSRPACRRELLRTAPMASGQPARRTRESRGCLGLHEPRAVNEARPRARASRHSLCCYLSSPAPCRVGVDDSGASTASMALPTVRPAQPRRNPVCRARCHPARRFRVRAETAPHAAGRQRRGSSS